MGVRGGIGGLVNDTEIPSVGVVANEFSIFICFREADEKLAKEFKKQIERASGRRISVHIFTDKANPEYMRWIHDEVRSSDLLILLHTDPAQNLTAIGYEIGLFRGSRDYGASKVIWFRSEGVTESPFMLSGIEPKVMNKNTVSEFLRKLLYQSQYHHVNYIPGEDDPAGLCNLITDDIVQFIPTIIEPEFYQLRLIISPIEISNVRSYEDQMQVVRPVGGGKEELVLNFEPAQVHVSETLLPMLGIQGRYRLTWRHFIEQLETRENLKTLPLDIMNIAQDDKLVGTYTRVLTPLKLNNKNFWPVISRIDRRNGIPVGFYLIFIEDPTAISRTDIFQFNNAQFDKLLNIVMMLNYSRRFRWSIVEPAMNRIWSALSRVDLADAYGVAKSLQNELDRMELCAKLDKLDVALNALASFEFDSEQEREEMLGMWPEYFNSRQSLNEAIDAQNYERVLEILDRFIANSRKFLTVASREYAKTVNATQTMDENAPDWRKELAVMVARASEKQNAQADDR
ncbi:MAG TPA: hypothetical protein DIW51_18250 [Rhodospirillaceae bacterium]|nr:hypothetical protein [Rhodospirillaceae bacterium]HCS71904.1 hypothetical protein [Rhodospirillaceae bacterium]